MKIKYEVKVFINDGVKSSGLRGAASPDIAYINGCLDVQNAEISRKENFKTKKEAVTYYNNIVEAANITINTDSSLWRYIAIVKEIKDAYGKIKDDIIKETTVYSI